jgi:membrane fusion protein (multidrug efflux system)
MVFGVSPDNKLVPRPVELDGWSRGEWVVTKGLQSGERVLVDGFIKAHDPGMTVKPVAIDAKTASSTTPAAPATTAAPAASASASAKGAH